VLTPGEERDKGEAGSGWRDEGVQRCEEQDVSPSTRERVDWELSFPVLSRTNNNHKTSWIPCGSIITDVYLYVVLARAVGTTEQERHGDHS
jgi:hypothetical protein